MRSTLPRLHVIADDAVVRRPDHPALFAALAARGARLALHLRGHGCTGAELFRATSAALAARGAAGADAMTVLVNDRIDVALAAGADGVQLGRRSLPVARARALLGDAARIGRSAHEAGEVAEAAAEGASFALLGTLWPTASHPGREGAGPGLVAAAAPAGLPLIGIGGVSPDRVAEVLAAGAWGVAALRGVWDREDAGAAVDAYLAALDAAAGS